MSVEKINQIEGMKERAEKLEEEARKLRKDAAAIGRVIECYECEHQALVEPGQKPPEGWIIVSCCDGCCTEEYCPEHADQASDSVSCNLRHGGGWR